MQSERRLEDRRYLAILLDGKGFGDHLLLAAMGIDDQGHKHVLGVWEGDSENAEVCQGALEDLGRRGLDVTRGVLVIIDGGKGLAAAVRTLWGDVAIMGRCRVHKQRSVFKHLPKEEQKRVRCVLQQAWHEPDAAVAEADLLALVAELEKPYPKAAASLREGLAETLICQRLGLPRELIPGEHQPDRERVLDDRGHLPPRVPLAQRCTGACDTPKGGHVITEKGATPRVA